MGLTEIFQKEMVLGSASIPGVIILIALIILFAWLILLIRFAYRRYRKYQLLNHISKEPMGSMKKMKPMMHRDDLRHYLGRIDTLRLKSKSQSPGMYIDELYHLVREFSIELLGIGHTYSDDELITIMSGHARQLARIYWHIAELRRHKPSLPRERFDSLLSELFSAISVHTKKKVTLASKAKGFFAPLIKLFRKSELSPEENKIGTLLTKEKAAFELNLSAVKDTCNKILRAYSLLPYSERFSMYSELMQFYHKVNDKLSSSLYGSKTSEELKFFPRELARIRDINAPKLGMSEKLKFSIFGIKREVQKPNVAVPAPEIKQQKLTVPKPSKQVVDEVIPVPKPAPNEAIEHINSLVSKGVKIKRIDHITRIYRLIEKSRKALLRGYMKTAKSSYESIKHNFVLLSEEEKKEVYPAITSLYNDLIKGVPQKAPKKVDLKSDLDEQERQLHFLLNKNLGMP